MTEVNITKYENLTNRLRLAKTGCVVESVKDGLISESLDAIIDLVRENIELNLMVDSGNPYRTDMLKLENSIRGLYPILDEIRSMRSGVNETS